MEFLTILIVLGLVQLWGSGGPFQRDGWFYQWMASVSGFIGAGKLRLVVIVAVPVVAVFFLQIVLDSLLFGLLSLLLFVAVLLFSLGRGDFSAALQSYLSAWNVGDYESAYEKALSIGDFKQSEAISDQQSLHDHVRMAMVYEGYQRWFAVVFWFLLLGPTGAAGYRLSYLCARSEPIDESEKLLALRFLHYLDWIPARLLALSFSLTGNFVSGFNRSWQTIVDNMPVAELLDTSALAATSSAADQRQRPTEGEDFIEFGGNEIVSVQSLLSRSVICWVAIVALLTVAGL